MIRWLVGVVILLGVFAGFWFFLSGDRLETDPNPTTVSPEAASSAEGKLAQLSSSGEARLSGVELTSLFRYRPELWSLGIVRTPAVTISDGLVRLAGRVATADVPADPTLDAIREFLPDTTDIRLAGRVDPVGDGTVYFRIEQVEIAGMPIPERFYERLLDRLGPERGTQLPPGALILPLPPEIHAARVEGSELILTP